MKKTDLAYIAGFFDGEGCIHIGKYRGCYHMRVTASQANEWIMNWLKFVFGGSVSKMILKEGHRQRWQWSTAGNKASLFLVAILPYLRLKRAEAELAIEFQGRRPGKGFRPTNTRIAIDEANRILMSKLKR